MNSKVVKLIGFANLTCVFNITTISCSTIKVKMDEVKIKYETLKGFESHKTKQVELSNLVKDQIILEKADLITKATLSPIVNKTIDLIQTAPLSTVKNVATFIHSESYKAYQKSSKSKTLIRKGITFLGTLALNGAISLVIYFEQYHPKTKHKIKSYLLSLLYAAIERFAFNEVPHNSTEFRELILNLFRYSDIQKENLYTFLWGKLINSIWKSLSLRNVFSSSFMENFKTSIQKIFSGEIFKDLFISGTGLLSSWATDIFKNKDVLMPLLDYLYTNKNKEIQWSFGNDNIKNFFKENINELEQSRSNGEKNNMIDLFLQEIKQNNNTELLDLTNLKKLIQNKDKWNGIVSVFYALNLKNMKNVFDKTLGVSKNIINPLFIVFFSSLFESIKEGLANYNHSEKVNNLNEKVKYFVWLILKLMNNIYSKHFKENGQIFINKTFQNNLFDCIMFDFNKTKSK
ncbi:hypothetical protein [Mycoplasma phocimorsus]|uniref:hypothetical protein n=1 Tax=Mycoplasma phocimorsus TaxID=3045839 RepID=UPI0024BF1A1C|nr:hypothetical protein [Mycoplasma phocimorsus]MDJ1648530.1 hypothetical protein [Mycoplasma phocimorsus]